MHIEQKTIESQEGQPLWQQQQKQINFSGNLRNSQKKATCRSQNSVFKKSISIARMRSRGKLKKLTELSTTQDNDNFDRYGETLILGP